ncbi:UNVERIFIED_CONTAM: Retrovirus-related Pol polyprotein from transposon TNT 1-94 [Sesamum calycinum]|uniref:Retrovirus-related Pol polyprotein from transposon TNT 1-94 n=1 Tax=Sesamum calycinum TaxID=2727403 RepID=A0AAW2LQW4_9LAMI
MNLGIAKHIGNKIGRFRDMETDGAGRALTEQIRLHRPILVFLSKTKCKTRRVDRLKERLNYNSIRVDSHGKGGGLMLLWWKDTEVELEPSRDSAEPRKKRPFRFGAAWTKEESCTEPDANLRRQRTNRKCLLSGRRYYGGHKVWGKEGHVSLKLDVSKAYDNVEWTFLEKGSLARLPVIPYLYLFCVEVFSAAIRRAENDGWLRGVFISRNAPRPKSLQQDSKEAVLITTERSWNLDMIREEFLAKDGECILSIPLSADQTKDAIVWHYGENGCFSVKSAYEVAMRISNQASTSTDQADWKMTDAGAKEILSVQLGVSWILPLRLGGLGVPGLRPCGEVWKELEIQFMSKSIANKLYLKQSALAHNQQKQKAGESSHGDCLYVKGNQDRGRRSENEGFEKRISRSKSRGRKTIHCYKCKEPGHMKRDCPKLKKQADEKRDDSSKSANMVQNDDSDCSDGDMLSISTNQYMDAWILDFGCFYHITPNREWFSSYRSGNSGSIYLGDDRCCNIVGVGDVRIKMYDGTVRTLSDVRHIPDLKKNLISLGTLHKNDFIPKADEDRETIRIVKGALTVMKGKITAGNIYKLLGSIVTKVSFTTGKHKTEGILDYVHSDVWGPTREQSLGGSLYYATFTNDFSRKVWVYVLKQKSEVFAKFKLWKAEVENQTGRKIKYLRSDNGTEYTDSQFQKFCEEHGIQRHFSVRLPKRFWVEAVSMACYLINRSPRASLGGNVAEEAWTGVKGYKFWDSTARKMVISRDAVFDEQSMLQQYQNEVPKVCSSSNTLQMELEPHPVATENRGRSHLTSGDPVTTESNGSSTTNELQAYNLARDRQRRTNVKPPSRLGYKDMVSFALQCSV